MRGHLSFTVRVGIGFLLLAAGPVLLLSSVERRSTLRGVGDESEWTILLYMNGKNNLEKDALNSFVQMADVSNGNPKINLVVEMGRPTPSHDPRFGHWSGVKRFFIRPLSQPVEGEALMDVGKSGGNTDMGSPQTFSDFITWGLRQYPAKKTLLIIWNHGQGWRIELAASNRAITADFESAINSHSLPAFLDSHGELPIVGGYRSVSYDGDTGNMLYNHDVETILRKMQRPLDILGFDTCLMAMMENAYAFKDVAKLMIGSEEIEPDPGWDYRRAFKPLFDNPQIDKFTLAKALVKAYADTYDDKANVTLSAVNLDATVTLTSALDSFVLQILPKIAIEAKAIRAARSLCSEYGGGIPTTPFVDLAHFLGTYQNTTTDGALKRSAEKIQRIIDSSVIADYASQTRKDRYGSTGLSIYFPKDYSSFQKDQYHDGYLPKNKLKPVDFVRQTHWPEFLQEFYKQP